MAPPDQRGAWLTAAEIESLDDAGLRLAFAVPEAKASLEAYFGPELAAGLAASMARDAFAPFAHGAGRTVLLLPGFLGSGLVDHGRLVDDLVWVDLFQLTMMDGLDRLELNEDGTRDRLAAARVLPGRPLRLFYDLLGAHLALRGGFRVEGAAFDWRRRIDESAAELHHRVERLCAGDPEGRVSIVAHSMGCLVCKRYFQLYPAAAERRIDHAVFIAPPLGGTFAPAELLCGDHHLVRRFGAFSLPLRDRLLRAFRTFPGLYELLPDPSRFDCDALFDPASWEAGRVVDHHLRDGLQAGERLRAPHPLLGRTSVVLSASLPTTAGATFAQGAPRFDRVGPGDGTVLVASAWDDGAAGHFGAAGEHNTLPLLPDVREAVLRLLLTRGEEAGALPRLARPGDAPLMPLSGSLRAPPAREAAASLALAARIGARAETGADVFWLLGAAPLPEPAESDALLEMPAATPARSAAPRARAVHESAPLLSPEAMEELHAAFAPPDAAPATDAARLVARPRAGAMRLLAPMIGGTRAAPQATVRPGETQRGFGGRQLGRWILKKLDYEVDDPREPPPLTRAQVQTIAQIYRGHPNAIERLLGIALKNALSDEEGPDTAAGVQRVLQEAQAFFDAPDPVQWLEARHAELEASPPPPGLSFDGYEAGVLPVQPSSIRFQPLHDLLGWLVYAALPAVRYHLVGEGIAELRQHDAFDSGFRYPLAPKTPGAPISVAVLGDFATGSYTSGYIARRLVRGAYDCAVHLGDVYYAGRRSELDARMRRPLAPMLDSTGLYLLAGNHEMYSGGYPLLDFIDEKRQAHPDVQRQEGPYFLLEAEHFQIIGLDTEWGGHGRVSAAHKQWLREVVAHGVSKGKINVLLTSNEPYAYGKEDLGPLLDDVLDAAGEDGISAWFWGNTHYFALFRRTEKTPFLGCCAGNGGYPYKRLRADLPRPVPTEFIETGGRFSGDLDGLSDRGDNGYCELTLGPGHEMKLVYRDWKGVARCTRPLAWDPASRRLDYRTP